MTAWVVCTAAHFSCWSRGARMNLYRSFGNLMEAWVTEGGPGLDSEWLGVNDEDSPNSSSNLRSESVDSGVETASSETSFPATSRSASTDNTEIDASSSQSPVLSSPVLSSSSSSSPHLHSSRPQEDSNALHQKLELTLKRTDSKYLKEHSHVPSVDEVLRRRPKRHTSDVARAHRSESFGLRTANPPAPTGYMSEICRRPTSLSCDPLQAEARREPVTSLSAVQWIINQSAQVTENLQVVGDEKRKDLSPGLCYLEQVCQMLEEIARQQMHSRALQMEMDALREHQEMEASQPADTCQNDSKAAEKDRLCSQNQGKANSLDYRRKNHHYGHFRQRSASDTTIALMHLKMLSTDCRGQHLSEKKQQEDVHKEQEPKKDESNAPHKNWRLKLGSLRREVSALKGQQMQPSERNSARRRLSQLFRRSRKTLPA